VQTPRPGRAAGAAHRRPPRARPVLLALAALALLVPGCAAAPTTTSGQDTGRPPTAERPDSRQEPLPPAGEVAAPPRGARPEAVEVPAIGVSAPLIRLGLQPDRRMEVPEDYSVAGWYTGGSRPGEPGPAVIVGHVDSKRGPAVFFRLGELRRGDVVVVRYPARLEVRFRVERTERHPKAAFPTRRVYGDTAGATLRLVTCGGTFDRASGHYRDNVIVFATALPR
jgi:sortase (surface protein transpeptidase)